MLKPSEFFLLSRPAIASEGRTHVLLAQRNKGGSTAGLLAGEMTPGLLARLAEALGLEVRVEEVPEMPGRKVS